MKLFFKGKNLKNIMELYFKDVLKNVQKSNVYIQFNGTEGVGNKKWCWMMKCLS